MMLLWRLALILCVTLPAYASAQADVGISTTPTYPGPHEDVVLTLSSYNFDINLATIVWKANNQTLLSGVGEKRLTVRTGDVGQSLTVSATVSFQNLDSITKALTISPQAVDMFFESKESHVPAFYQGKTLPSEGAFVRVIAMPYMNDRGSLVKPETLSYSWYSGGEFLDALSGVGRQSAVFSLDYLSDMTSVRVLVRSPQGNVVEQTLSIYPHPIQPMIYAYDPVLGVDLTHAFIRRMELVKNMIVSLEPYYLSNRNGLEKTATYEWYLDGLPVTPQEKTLLGLQPKENSSGVRTLRVVVENTKRALQKATADLELIFDTRQ
jgi:hypothetical protein